MFTHPREEEEVDYIFPWRLNHENFIQSVESKQSFRSKYSFRDAPILHWRRRQPLPLTQKYLKTYSKYPIFSMYIYDIKCKRNTFQLLFVQTFMFHALCRLFLLIIFIQRSISIFNLWRCYDWISSREELILLSISEDTFFRSFSEDGLNMSPIS